MEKESRSERASRGAPDPDPFLQWGNRKRLRCIKSPDSAAPGRSRRANPRVVRRAEELASPPLHPTPFHHNRKSESAGNESQKPARSVRSSPENEDRFYSTRGSAAAAGCDENVNGNGNGAGAGDEKGAMALPRFFLSLSNKEKEEDFLAMKGCKLPQRPKKRSKFVQKSILLVSPGAWLTDLSQERYEVREKKSSRKKKRGLKAMCIDSDSE